MGLGITSEQSCQGSVSALSWKLPIVLLSGELDGGQMTTDKFNKFIIRKLIYFTLRPINRLTQEEVAEKLGFPVETLQKSEQRRIPSILRLIRSELGLSQKELAKQLHTSIDNLQNWEQGRHKPKPHLLLLLEHLVNSPNDKDSR